MVCGAEWMIMLQSAWIIALLSHWRLTDKCLYAGNTAVTDWVYTLCPFPDLFIFLPL